MVAQGSVQPSENRRGIRAALVLTGGGFPGALFEIGALVALDEMMGEECSSTDFDLYVGSSAGSVVGLLLALGVPPEELRKMVLGQSPSLPHLRRQDLFRVQSLPRRLGLSFRHVLRVLRHFSRSGMGIRLSSFLVALLEGLPSGLLSLVPLRSTLEQIIIDLGKTDRFSALPRSLYVPTFELDTGRRVVWGAPGWRESPVSLAVTASCAIPGLFQPVSINGKDYIDGNTGEVTHLDLAMDAGAQVILVLNPVVPIENDQQLVCLRALDGSCASLGEKGLRYVIEQAQRVSRAAKLDSEVSSLRSKHPDCHLFVLQPDPKRAELFLRSPISDQQRGRILSFGYRTARRFLELHGKALAESLNQTDALRLGARVSPVGI